MSAHADQDYARVRCFGGPDDPLMMRYHDEEWGVPERDDQALFEKLLLDGFQAGLSWLTILRKRDNFRRAFAGFEPAKMARFGPKKIESLMQDKGIVRNRLKVESAVRSAQAYLQIRETGQSFEDFIWQFTDGRTITNQFREMADIPTETAESRAMSKALKAAGFNFCGPTICYAFMQATGIVNDHVVDCFRHDQV